METLSEVKTLPPEDCAARFSFSRIDRLEVLIGLGVVLVAAVVAALAVPLLVR